MAGLTSTLEHLMTVDLRAMISERIATVVEAGKRWVFAGREAADGDVESDSMHVCQGVGQVAVPAAPGDVSAIVVFVGGDGDYPYAVALRDLRAQQAANDAGINTDAWLAFTSSLFLIMKDGVIEARSRSGTAVALATKADHDALRDWVRNQFSAAGGHTHVVVGAGTTTIATVAAPGTSPAPSVPPTATGTTVLKAE
jgi:hypothetical protein